jgi:elongation factor P
MHQDTFEQVSIQEHMIENADLLKEGQYVEMMVEAEKENILTCELLPFVEMEVTYTEPGSRAIPLLQQLLSQQPLKPEQ